MQRYTAHFEPRQAAPPMAYREPGDRHRSVSLAQSPVIGAEAFAVAVEQLERWRREKMTNSEIYAALGTPCRERSLCPRRADLLALIAAAWLGVAR